MVTRGAPITVPAPLPSAGAADSHPRQTWSGLVTARSQDSSPPTPWSRFARMTSSRATGWWPTGTTTSTTTSTVIGARVHSLLDFVVDGHFEAVESLDDQSEQLEDLLYVDRPRDGEVRHRSFELRKSLVHLRRVVPWCRRERPKPAGPSAARDLPGRQPLAPSAGRPVRRRPWHLPRAGPAIRGRRRAERLTRSSRCPVAGARAQPRLRHEN